MQAEQQSGNADGRDDDDIGQWLIMGAVTAVAALGLLVAVGLAMMGLNQHNEQADIHWALAGQWGWRSMMLLMGCMIWWRIRQLHRLMMAAARTSKTAPAPSPQPPISQPRAGRS